MPDGKNKSELIEMVGQINRNDAKRIESVNLQSIERVENAIAEITRGSRNFINLICSSVSAIEAIAEISKSLANQYQQILSLSKMPNGFFEKLAAIQTSTAYMSSILNTEMIDGFTRSFAAMNIPKCTELIQQTVNMRRINMQDYSFIRISDMVKEIEYMLSYPYGFSTAISKFAVSSAKQLAGNTEIEFDTKDRVYKCGEVYATTDEINPVCSAVRFFSALSSDEVFTEQELMDFMSFYEKNPSFGVKHPVAEKILNVVEHALGCIDFDRDLYYHSRKRDRDTMPYTEMQMRKAPYGKTRIGRYNWEGQAHFYFADTKNGAENEIRKHIDGAEVNSSVIQTAEIRCVKPIRMLDISMKTYRGLNTFLKFLTYQISDDAGNRPRQYLITNYVADCCKQVHIDGIKYYGGKDYSNYVAWEDEYFDCVRLFPDADI